MALSDKTSSAETSFMTALFMGQSSLNFINNLQALARIVSGWMSVTIEVFIRRDFGERYLNLLRVISALMLMRTFMGLRWLRALFLDIIPEALRPELAPAFVFNWFQVAFVAMALLHILFILIRNRQSVLWHSQSFGISFLSFLPVNDWVLYRYIEPALCFGVGTWLHRYDPLLGGWIQGSSVALFVSNNLVYNSARSRILDIMDSQIEGTYFQKMAAGEKLGSKRETAGFSVVPVAMDRLTEAMESAAIAETVAETMGEASGVAQPDEEQASPPG